MAQENRKRKAEKDPEEEGEEEEEKEESSSKGKSEEKKAPEHGVWRVDKDNVPVVALKDAGAISTSVAYHDKLWGCRFKSHPVSYASKAAERHRNLVSEALITAYRNCPRSNPDYWAPELRRKRINFDAGLFSGRKDAAVLMCEILNFVMEPPRNWEKQRPVVFEPSESAAKDENVCALTMQFFPSKDFVDETPPDIVDAYRRVRDLFGGYVSDRVSKMWPHGKKWSLEEGNNTKDARSVVLASNVSGPCYQKLRDISWYIERALPLLLRTAAWDGRFDASKGLSLVPDHHTINKTPVVFLKVALRLPCLQLASLQDYLGLLPPAEFNDLSFLNAR